MYSRDGRDTDVNWELEGFDLHRRRCQSGNQLVADGCVVVDGEGWKEMERCITKATAPFKV